MKTDSPVSKPSKSHKTPRLGKGGVTVLLPKEASSVPAEFSQTFSMKQCSGITITNRAGVNCSLVLNIITIPHYYKVPTEVRKCYPVLRSLFDYLDNAKVILTQEEEMNVKKDTLTVTPKICHEIQIKTRVSACSTKTMALTSYTSCGNTKHTKGVADLTVVVDDEGNHVVRSTTPYVPDIIDTDDEEEISNKLAQEDTVKWDTDDEVEEDMITFP